MITEARATVKDGRQLLRDNSNNDLVYSMEVAQYNPDLCIYLHGDIMVLHVFVAREILHLRWRQKKMVIS